MRFSQIKSASAVTGFLLLCTGCDFHYMDSKTLGAALTRTAPASTPPRPGAPQVPSSPQDEPVTRPASANDNKGGKGEQGKKPGKGTPGKGTPGKGKDKPEWGGSRPGWGGRPSRPENPGEMAQQRPPRPRPPGGPQQPGPQYPGPQRPGQDPDRDPRDPSPRDPDARDEFAQAGHALGDSCRGGSLCLGLKYVIYQDPYGDPIQTDLDVIDTVREANLLWSECGIQFEISKYLVVAPSEARLRYRTRDYPELDEIRRRFSDRETLLVVATGSWDRSGSLGSTGANAWTNLPGEGTYGVVMERPVSRDPNILAHELGHYLSLGHADHASSLMHPLVHRDSSWLSPGECESARWAARHFWKRMIR